MTSQVFVGRLLREIATAFKPVEDALAGPEAFAALLAEFGWTLPSAGNFNSVTGTFNAVSQGLTALDEAATALDAVLSASGSGLPQVIEASTKAISDLTRALRALEQTNAATLPAPFDQANFWQSTSEHPSFPEELLGYVVYRYIERRLPILFGVLRFLGIFEARYIEPATLGRLPYARRRVLWNRIPSIAADPQKVLTIVYAWGGKFDHRLFTSNVQALLRGFGVQAGTYPLGPELNDYFDADAADRNAIQTVRALLFWRPVDDGNTLGHATLELVVVPIPPSGKRKAWPGGFAVYPQVAARLGTQLKVTDAVSMQIGGSFKATVVRLEIRYDAVSVVLTPVAATLAGELKLQATPAAPWVVLGAKDTIRVEVSEAHVTLGVAGSVNDLEYTITAAADRAALVLDFGEGDNFLRTLLGTESQRLDLSMFVAWSSKSGLTFGGNIVPEITLPIHRTIAGILTAETITLRLSPAPGSAELQVALTGGVRLGPITATVERVGLRLIVTDVGTTGAGNLGVLDLAFGFKPPEGVGMSVDAGPITGGGFISFDAAKGQYAGILQLRIGEFSITAIGLLDTKLPGGQTGYSFLIIITAKFPPIQLGFGFTLNGLGGLAGIHRTMVTAAIQAGIRSRSVDHILFPENPVRDAVQIISSLTGIFPPATGRYVFGPMAIIGYGTPTLIEAEIGILLELPDPVRLVLLGQVHALLPTKQEAVVELHLDVLGVVEFAEQRLEIEAVIHDSRLAAFDLTGGMALQLAWGPEPVFAMAVGGFHPAFQPPPRFPAVERLTLALGDGGNPRLTMQAYLALTSNTVQFGARADIYAEALSFNVTGTLGFDVLVIVSPFSLLAELDAMVVLRRGNMLIASVWLDATLTGPTPWHLWGEAVFDTFIDIRVPFDHTIGEDVEEHLPAVDPTGDLVAAFGDIRNWTATLPPAGRRVVTLTAAASEAALPLIEPLGGAQVRQRVAPLNKTLTKVGEARPPQPLRYTVGGVTVGATSATMSSFSQEFFAPAQFEELSDADKLSRPSFERMDAGFGLSMDAVALAAAAAIFTPVRLETEIIDQPTAAPAAGPRYDVAPEQIAASLGTSAAARAPLATTGEARFAPSPGAATLVTLKPTTYEVRYLDNLDAAAVATGRTKTEAYDKLAAHLKNKPADAGRLQVVPAEELAA